MTTATHYPETLDRPQGSNHGIRRSITLRGVHPKIIWKLISESQKLTAAAQNGNSQTVQDPKGRTAEK